MKEIRDAAAKAADLVLDPPDASRSRQRFGLLERQRKRLKKLDAKREKRIKIDVKRIKRAEFGENSKESAWKTPWHLGSESWKNALLSLSRGLVFRCRLDAVDSTP